MACVSSSAGDLIVSFPSDPRSPSACSFAFSYKEYSDLDRRSRTFSNYLGAVWDTIWFGDFALEIWHSWYAFSSRSHPRTRTANADRRLGLLVPRRVFFWRYMLGKPGTSSKDINGFDHRLEVACVSISCPSSRSASLDPQPDLGVLPSPRTDSARPTTTTSSTCTWPSGPRMPTARRATARTTACAMRSTRARRSTRRLRLRRASGGSRPAPGCLRRGGGGMPTAAGTENERNLIEMRIPTKQRGSSSIHRSSKRVDEGRIWGGGSRGSRRKAGKRRAKAEGARDDTRAKRCERWCDTAGEARRVRYGCAGASCVAMRVYEEAALCARGVADAGAGVALSAVRCRRRGPSKRGAVRVAGAC